MPDQAEPDIPPNNINDEILDDTEKLLRFFLEQRNEDGREPARDDQTEFQEFDEEIVNLFARIDEDLFTDEAPDEVTGEENEGWILGDFKLLRKLGAGGMGTVYEAEQLSLKRKVALKILPNHLRFSSDAIKKFRREAEAGGRQSHSGIISIYAVGQDRGVPYIAQELVEGGRTLADYLKVFQEQHPLPQGYFREVTRLMVQAAEALHHAHLKGVIHRDVKPSNLLISEQGQIKVTDFGLAKMEDVLTHSRTGTFAGTPYYLAPELTLTPKSKPGPWTDVYSLGVTLYEALSFKRPFDGASSHEILKKIVSQEPKDPRQVNPRVPRDLAVICLKALEKKPRDRYPDMKAFADDLQRFLSGDVILARPATLLQKINKRIRRNPALSIAVAVAALTLIVFVASIPWTMARLTDERDKAREAEAMAMDQAEIAAKQFEEIVRLTDAKFLSQMIEKFHQIWPAHPAMVSEMDRWLQAAESLTGRLDSHRKVLGEIGQRIESEGVSSDDRSWEYEEATTVWHANMLEDLIVQIEAFADEESGLIEWMRDRREFASSVYNKTIEREWNNWQTTIKAIADLSAHPEYNGLLIEPQLGLIPLGPDPLSGLFEFAHLQTGKVPTRDSTGKLDFNEHSGLVFVLVPGGAFEMGSRLPSEEHPEGTPNVDPYGSLSEKPVHTVTLKPFFLSKYEMSQEQWKRFTRVNPSEYNAILDAGVFCEHLINHPVEYISYSDCMKELPKLTLRLPSEAEWEYAARAGTTTVYWTGDDKKTLTDAANISDAAGWRYNEAISQFYYEMWLDDGYSKHAPVDSFRPNPFGFYNMTGNVTEWCEDRFNFNYEGAPTDGSAWSTGMTNYVGRGGDYNVKAEICRSAIRFSMRQNDKAGYIGVRPAMSLRTGDVKAEP